MRCFLHQALKNKLPIQSLHFTIIKEQTHAELNPKQLTLLNPDYTSSHGRTEGMQFSGLDYASSSTGYMPNIAEFDDSNHHLPSEMNYHQELTEYYAHQERFAYSAEPYSGGIESSMGDMYQSYPDACDHTTTAASQSSENQQPQQQNPWDPTQTMQSQTMASQSFQSQQPVQQHNSWDPTQTVHLQAMAKSAPIPLIMQITYRTPCSWQSCTESFTRVSDLQRHIESVHLGIRNHCFWIGCANNRGKGCCRAEKLRTH